MFMSSNRVVLAVNYLMQSFTFSSGLGIGIGSAAHEIQEINEDITLMRLPQYGQMGCQVPID